MENIDFNKSLFVRNDDIAFKIAVMYTNIPKVHLSTQEILFYSNKSIVKSGINFLTFTDMYNETWDYVNNWIAGLDTLKDEQDWEFHRSKLLTRFNMQKRFSYDQVIEELAGQKCAMEIKNTSILWNNSIFLSEKEPYKNTKNQKAWELWNALVKLKDGQLDEISGSESLIKEFKKIVKYRNENEFYQKHSLNLDNNHLIMKEIDETEKQLSVIFLKDKLTKEIPIISAIKKRLKI